MNICIYKPDKYSPYLIYIINKCVTLVDNRPGKYQNTVIVNYN
jgi:hypothetical protein